MERRETSTLYPELSDRIRIGDYRGYFLSASVSAFANVPALAVALGAVGVVTPRVDSAIRDEYGVYPAVWQKPKQEGCLSPMMQLGLALHQLPPIVVALMDRWSGEVEGSDIIYDPCMAEFGGEYWRVVFIPRQGAMNEWVALTYDEAVIYLSEVAISGQNEELRKHAAVACSWLLTLKKD